MDRRALLLIALSAFGSTGCVCSTIIDPDPALFEADGGDGDGGQGCDDGVACTFDRVSDGVCENVPDDGVCGEGGFCLLGAGCIPRRPCARDEDCDDADACTADRCERDRGACAVATAIDCDDDVFCNGDEACDPSAGCVPGPVRDCRDEIDCTQDSCDEAAGACVHAPHDEACDDGRACNGVEACDEARGCRAGTPACPDDGDCAPERCIEVAAGDARCSSTPDHAACGDGSLCVASGGDGFACEAAPCGGDGQCDDGIACNGDETCEDGACQPGAPTACDDGRFCNGEEICDDGDCVSTLPPTCDDGAACTSDTCDVGADACAWVYDDEACQDGSDCNGAETCGARGCEPAANAGCTGDDPCVRSVCDEDAGECVETAPPETCNGLDDDCDGEPDDGLTCGLGTARACEAACSGSPGLEPCAADCTWSGDCVVRETCNGVDDDCDGDVDESADTFPPCPPAI